MYDNLFISSWVCVPISKWMNSIASKLKENFIKGNTTFPFYLYIKTNSSIIEFKSESKKWLQVGRPFVE